jgi:hypothetical protein
MEKAENPTKSRCLDNIIKMGFFVNAKPVLDLMNAAGAINERLRTINPYLCTSSINQDFKAEDRHYIQSIIDCLDDELAHMLCCMQKIPIHKQKSVKVQTINGHYVSASGYIKVMHYICTMLKKNVKY